MVAVLVPLLKGQAKSRCRSIIEAKMGGMKAVIHPEITSLLQKRMCSLALSGLS